VFLGIDIGTSAVKAVVMDQSGATLAASNAPLQVSRPQPLWSEQDPEEWWSAVERAVFQLPATHRAPVKAIGLSGQMHGATVLDRDHVPLRPAILWNDGRSAKECVQLQAAEPDFLTHGANLVMPGFTAPKLAWLRRHEPSVFDRIATVLLPKDFIRLKLTGELASDRSDSAGTLWMDVAKRQWHAPLLHACGLAPEQMPKLYDGPEITGHLRATVAASWGLQSVPVVAGAGDNAAGAVGAGVVNKGDTLISLGTSGVIFAATESFYSRPESAVHSFCHALPGRWHLMSVMLSAASCLDWGQRLVGAKNVEAFVRLAEQADAHDAIAFLPYLSGERTPHNNAHAAGALLDLRHDTGPAQVANAILKGVAFGLADGFDALIGAGATIESLSVIGGGAQSQHWGKLLAASIGRPLVYRNGAAAGPALGAARLAQSGLNGSVAFAPPPVINTLEPDRALVDLLAHQRERFKNLYRLLEPSFKETCHVAH
jgi:xylulokinase